MATTAKGLVTPTQALSQDELAAQFNAFSTHVINGRISPSDYFSISANKSQKILRSYIKSVDDIQTASIDGLVAYQEQAMNSMSVNASQLIGVLKNVGGNLLLILGTQLAVKLGEYIWENLPFTEKHKQKVAEYAEKALQALNDNLDKNKENTDTVEAMAEDFNKLAQGVSYTGENLSLTNEQYDTYKSYVEQLIKINPELVKGINDQGEAFINNKEAIEETIKALKEQQRAIYAGFFNGKEDADVFENLVDRYEDSVGKINADLGFNPSITHKIQENLQDEDLYSFGFLLNRKNINKTDEERLLSLLGVSDKASFYKEIKSNAVEIATRINENKREIIDIAGKYNYDEKLGGWLDTNRDLLVQLDQEKENLERTSEEFDEYVDKYARSRKTYYDLTSQQQKMVEDYIDTYNFADKIFADGADEDVVERQMRQDVDEYISFLYRLSDKANEAINQIGTLDKSKLSYADYKAQADELIKKIVNDKTFNSDLMSEEQLRVQLGVDFETDDGKIENEYDNMVENILNRFEQKSTYSTTASDTAKYRDTLRKKIQEELTPDQITKLFNNSDLNIFSSWDKALESVTVSQRFDISTYQESIDEVTKDLTTLGEAYKKFKMGEFKTSAAGATKEVGELVKQFPELAKYIDYSDKGFGNLGEGLEYLINTRPDKLLNNIRQLGELVDGDANKVKQLQAYFSNLQIDALGGEVSYLVQRGLTQDDYLDYVNHDYDQIIKKLEEQKEQTENVNSELEKQKETLDKIVDEYEIAGNTVIKALDDKIDEITDFYDEQINKLKEENEEIEKNIDLQKKRDALANARKNKVRVYSETEGWHYEKNTTAIEEAEKELAKAEREVKIQELEKERDAEIKLWEDYKKAWEDAMESYTKAHDEAITDGILGSEWRENVMARDEDMLNTYQQNYFNFKNQLDNSIDEQIEKNKEYVDSIDKKIKEYQKDKQAIQDYVDEIEFQNKKYFGLIDQIKIDENSTWAERLANLEEFKTNYVRMMAEVAAANNEEPPTFEEPKLKLKYTGTNERVKSSPILNEEFDDEASANEARHKLASNIRNEILGALPVYMRTKERSQQIFDDIYNTLKLETVKGSYANGGVIDYTGNAAVHGSPSHAEVALNSSQGREVYEFIKSGILTKATSAMSAAYNALVDILPKPKLGGLALDNISIKNPMGGINPTAQSGDNSVVVQFQNPVIYAENYEQFDAYMSKYMNQALLELQVKK